MSRGSSKSGTKSAKGRERFTHGQKGGNGRGGRKRRRNKANNGHRRSNF